MGFYLQIFSTFVVFLTSVYETKKRKYFNICKLKPAEISVYLSFFPLPSVLFVRKERQKRQKR